MRGRDMSGSFEFGSGSENDFRDMFKTALLPALIIMLIADEKVTSIVVETFALVVFQRESPEALIEARAAFTLVSEPGKIILSHVQGSSDWLATPEGNATRYVRLAAGVPLRFDSRVTYQVWQSTVTANGLPDMKWLPVDLTGKTTRDLAPGTSLMDKTDGAFYQVRSDGKVEFICNTW